MSMRDTEKGDLVLTSPEPILHQIIIIYLQLPDQK